MILTTGSYTGDGNDDRWINDPGFEPDLVLIKGDTNEPAVWRSSAMSGDESAYFSEALANVTNRIQAFGANGFQIGDDAEVNSNGVDYYWAAFRDNGAGDFAVGTYQGDGNDNRNLAIVGFTPTVLWIKGDYERPGVWRIYENVGDDSLHFSAEVNMADCIQSFIANGFQVGTNFRVNRNTTDYYYVAFLDVSGYIETGNYTGDGNDDRWINDPGFEPDLVFDKGDLALTGVMRTDTMGAGQSARFDSNALAANWIQAFGANGFQVGDDNRVNQNEADFYWACWKAGTTGATTTTTTTLAPTTTTTTTMYPPTTTTTTTLAPTTTTTTLPPTTTTTTTITTSTIAPTTTTTTTVTTTVTTTLPPVPLGTPTHFQSKELSIGVYSPSIAISITRTTTTTLTSTTSTTTLVTTTVTTTTSTTTTLAPIYTPNALWLEDVSTKVDAYSHKIAAFGGYEAASLTMKGTQIDIEDWVENGLGRYIEIHDHALCTIWEGFVNKLTVNVGGLGQVIGPLLNVGNRVSVMYSPVIDATADPPIVGTTQPTVIAEEQESQVKYGIIEKVLSGGTVTTADALQYRDTFLYEHAWPESGETIAPGAGKEPSVKIELLGFAAWLKAYVFSSAQLIAVTLSDKIKRILAANPNAGQFSVDFTKISTNSLLTILYENDNTIAETIIKALVALGDINDHRWLFGFYAGRRAVYEQAPDPDDVAYVHRLSDRAQRVETLSGDLIYPWNVLPGKWLFIPDFLVGRSEPSDRRQDLRYVFIESVEFTAPWQLKINGQKLSELPQLLAKQGLGGASG